MFYAKPDIGVLSKHSGELLQWYFAVAEANQVANTQTNPPNTYPAIVPMHKCAIPGIGIRYPQAAAFIQLEVGVRTGNCCVFKNEVA